MSGRCPHRCLPEAARTRDASELPFAVLVFKTCKFRAAPLPMTLTLRWLQVLELRASLLWSATPALLIPCRPGQTSLWANKMLAAVAALVLSQDSSLIDPGPSGVSSPTAKGANPAVDTYPATGVLTDAGIDTTCTDIDFDKADVTVSNLGGTDNCCTICGDFLCCPTINENNNGMVRAHTPAQTSETTVVGRTRACTAPPLPASVHRTSSRSRKTSQTPGRSWSRIT